MRVVVGFAGKSVRSEIRQFLVRHARRHLHIIIIIILCALSATGENNALFLAIIIKTVQRTSKVDSPRGCQLKEGEKKAGAR